MRYEVMEKTFCTLPEEQQQIVYNLVLSLGNLPPKGASPNERKRSFGKFAGKATATFTENSSMTEAELCSL
ncbi:MAG: hypothetical protein K2J81_06805 [Treponemataceae bacterium]|nr:hypothetical protein [Treponemataceae bacterium]